MMEILNSIKSKVDNIVNNNTDKIVMGVYRNMINTHNEFCGCDYCNILSEYVRLKKIVSIKNKKVNNPDYNYAYNDNYASDINEISNLRIKITELKIIKNNIKRDLNI